MLGWLSWPRDRSVFNARLAEAHQRIAGARDDARGAVRDLATESAQAIVARLTGAEPTLDAARAEVDAALAR